MRTFLLPDLGEGLEDAEIVTWYVAEGDVVVADQPLVAVETDKAVMEIPAPWAGRITKLHGAVGDIIATDAPLVDFDEAGESQFSGIVGSVETNDAAPAETPATPPTAAPTPPPTRRPVIPEGERIIQASPAVRALAKRLGVDLSAVVPTGPRGLATAADVERAASRDSDEPTFTPLRGPRRAMSEAMARSHAEVVPATMMDDADVDAWAPGTDAMVRLVRAIVAACAAEPSLNAWLQSGAEGRRLHSNVDLGIAVDAPDGLFVPVLRGVESLDAAETRSRLDELIAQTRNRTVAAEDLRGATISLSNFGALGGQHAMLVVVPPQVAILGAGRAMSRVVAVDGQPAVHRVLPLSLTVDHRVVSGGEAARFLAAAVRDLELPE